MAAFYAEDAKLLAENTELIRGRKVIEEFWRQAIGRARAAGAIRTIGLDEVTSSGDLGYVLATVTVRISGGRQLVTKYATSGSATPTAADGRWRLAVDSSSPNPPLVPCADLPGGTCPP
jgi:ketosteroid isomerase-like protein